MERTMEETFSGIERPSKSGVPSNYKTKYATHGFADLLVAKCYMLLQDDYDSLNLQS